MPVGISLPLQADPREREDKVVFAHFTVREAITGLVIFLICLAVAVLLWRFYGRINAYLVCVALALVVGLVAFVGLYKMHGVYIETWLPALLRERKASKVMATSSPKTVFSHSEPKPKASRAEKKAARAEKKAAKQERKTAPKQDSELALSIAQGKKLVDLPQEDVDVNLDDEE